MNRYFAVRGDLVHDPATGLTHRAPHQQPDGRVVLDDSTVAEWPTVVPASTGRTTPVSLCWSPLVRCNLHCPQCLDDTTVPELAAVDRHRIAAVLAASDVLGVDISGGEPLLLRDLPGLIAVLRRGERCAVSITTNGWHLDLRAAELTRVDAIRISLDGPDIARHDRIRGHGSFARACGGIRTAVDTGIPVQVQTVLMTSTADRAQDMVDLAHVLGAGGVTFLQMLPIGSGAALIDEMLDDPAATALVDTLQVPAGLRVRLRTRKFASGFTVVRADGRVWRNADGAHRIGGLHALTQPGDLVLTSTDGSA